MFNSTNYDEFNSDNSTFELLSEPEFIKVSIYTPIIYLTILITVFVVFSSIYRKKKLNNRINQVNSLFPRNYSKEMYLQLKQQDPKPNDKILKAALLRRGSECIRKMFKLRENEPNINALYQKGSIGHDYFESFQLEKKLNELEMNELVQEANSIKANWAQQFFPICQEITINEALRRRLNALESRKTESLKEWGILGDLLEKSLKIELDKKNGKKK